MPDSFYPYGASMQQFRQGSEAGLLDAQGGLSPAEVIQDEGNPQLGDVIGHVGDEPQVGVDLYGEPKRHHPLSRRGDGAESQSRAPLALGFKIDPDAAHTGVVEILERHIAHGLGIDDSHTAGHVRPQGCEGGEKAPVVGAVDARLDEHNAANAKATPDEIESLNGCCTRRVRPVHCIREAFGVEDVDVAIACARRNSKAGLADPPRHVAGLSRTRSGGSGGVRL